MASSWFPLYGRDFLAATLGWTAEERGHYATLLIAQWEQGGLPDDVKRLELISPGVGRCWDTIASKFPMSNGGLRKNTRLEHERHISHQKSERARQSASARWANEASKAEPSGDECDGTCERICDRICSDDASISISYSPPPPPPPPAFENAEAREGWQRLRDAWNAAWGDKRQWRSSEPPPDAIARLSEPGWLEDALEAIPAIKKGACSGFKTPPSLSQFCRRDQRGSFVARLLGGEFTDTPRPVRAHNGG
jgi:uncharacterized protein YdaU (DUF1376 family)